ncbi:MAG: Gfo/Idh/MocA family oxidoreductase [Myxococcales bacterium]|nr:Gfo/Idh/MocA family oxidoreductase [Myxococcales bacterium]MDH5567771.1 Gfo/Idh/MocA family oxidoreductase [Myxococcales bacterium]
MKPLRIAVIGVGHMGRRHAEKVAELARRGHGVVLAGVTDTDTERARTTAEALGTRAVSDRRDLCAGADAAIVAVSTVAHFAVARDALAAGLDVLVEKPIAATLEDAEALVALAARENRVLHVGHQEWFNAAMRVVRERIEAPRFAEIHRLGMFSERGTDVDVVRDLMIHDLEILQQLLGEEPERIDAVGIPVLTDHVDIANARLTFGSRCAANLTASRVSMTPMRKFRIFQRDAYFSIDFLEQKAVLFRRYPPLHGEKPRIEMEELKTDPEDSLRAQLESFVGAVRSRLGDGDALGAIGVTGVEATAALRTALRVIDAMPSTHEFA